jgi:hypothetical protein
MNWSEIDPAIWTALGVIAAFFAKDIWPWLRARLDTGYAQRLQEQQEERERHEQEERERREQGERERRELVEVIKHLDTVNDSTLRQLTAFDFRTMELLRLHQQQQVTNDRIATALEILAEHVAGSRRERRPRPTASQG